MSGGQHSDQFMIIKRFFFTLKTKIFPKWHVPFLGKRAQSSSVEFVGRLPYIIIIQLGPPTTGYDHLEPLIKSRCKYRVVSSQRMANYSYSIAINLLHLEEQIYASKVIKNSSHRTGFIPVMIKIKI